MSYERKKKDVQAIQLLKSVFDSEGNELAKKGDWLVIEGSDQFYMSDKEFNDEFAKKQECDEQPIIIWRDRPYYYPIYIDRCEPCWPHWPQQYPWINYAPSTIGGLVSSTNDTKVTMHNHSIESETFDESQFEKLSYCTSSTSNCMYESRT